MIDVQKTDTHESGRHFTWKSRLYKQRWGGQYSILMGGVETPNTFDLHESDVLVASDRSIPEMEGWMRRTGNRRVALVDGEDDTHLRYAPEKVRAYFKREYALTAHHPSNVFPLPFGAIAEKIPDAADVTNQVVFMCHESQPVRKKISDTLQAMKFPLNKDRVSKEEYNRILASSLVGVSTRGGGWDTYRYWETAYFGCALLSQRLEIVIPGNFVEMLPAGSFKESGTGVNTLMLVIDKPE